MHSGQIVLQKRDVQKRHCNSPRNIDTDQTQLGETLQMALRVQRIETVKTCLQRNPKRLEYFLSDLLVAESQKPWIFYFKPAYSGIPKGLNILFQTCLQRNPKRPEYFISNLLIAESQKAWIFYFKPDYSGIPKGLNIFFQTCLQRNHKRLEYFISCVQDRPVLQKAPEHSILP
jgi:hypothetical protein